MPARKESFTATEIKAGALVLVSAIILLGFMIVVRGCAPRADSVKTYTANFTDISGLNSGADVRFGGVKVGRVLDLGPDPEERALIRVTAEVMGDVPVNRGSVASIEQITLTSAKHLEISTGDPDVPLHEDGDRLQTTTGAGAFGLPDLEGVVARLERLLDGLNTLTGSDPGSGEGTVDLGEVLVSLKSSLDGATATLDRVDRVVEENRPAMREVVDRLAKLETSASQLLDTLHGVLGENREPLHASAVNLEHLTADARRRLEELGTSLEQLTAHLESVGANADDLMEDQRPALEEVLFNLRQTTRNLREFSRTLADQPESLIRGKSAQGRK